MISWLPHEIITRHTRPRTRGRRTARKFKSSINSWMPEECHGGCGKIISPVYKPIIVCYRKSSGAESWLTPHVLQCMIMCSSMLASIYGMLGSLTCKEFSQSKPSKFYALSSEAGLTAGYKAGLSEATPQKPMQVLCSQL